MIVVLVLDRFKASKVFLMAIAVMILSGLLPVKVFLEGFVNTSILSIFLIIIITSSINAHFNLSSIFDRLFSNVKGTRPFLVRMGVTVAGVSSVMNNTPVVAIMMPYIYNWANKFGISHSKLLIPLSYSAILGGGITLIGTSTNLVLNGLLSSNGKERLDFMDFVAPGLILTITGLLFIVWLAPRLLRETRDAVAEFRENRREYIVEVLVGKKGNIGHKTVEEAGLRNLKAAFLAEIHRGVKHISPVTPTQVILPGDVLLFAGETDTILDLVEDHKDLELSKKSKFKISEDAELVEAVIPYNSTLERRTLKEMGFREKYDAAVVGIHRRGERLSGKIGSHALRVGDLLLLTAGSAFRERSEQHDDLIPINTLQQRRPLGTVRRWLFGLSLVFSVAMTLVGFFELFDALLLLLFVQVLTGMTTVESVKSNISFDLLIILMGALALGNVLISSGAADQSVEWIFHGAHEWHPVWILVLLFAITFGLTSAVTNVAAVSIIFPVVYALSTSGVVPDKALFLTAAYGASCCFVTPFAYQTNLIVMEAGNYKFADFVRLGLPLSILYGLVLLTYIVFKFDLM